MVVSLIAVMVFSLFIVAGCSSDDAAGNRAATDETAGDTSGTEESAGSDNADDNNTVAPSEDTPETLTVRVYFASSGDRAFAVEREIPYTQAVAAAAMKELLAGPTANELAVWTALNTQIPEGTELLGITIQDGVARVDLSDDFDDGGGSFSVTARVAQVVYTLCEFSSVDAVEFYMEGELIDLFTGEGLELDGPQTPEDYYSALPIDA